MALRYVEAGVRQLLRQRVGHRHTAVMPASAAHGNHQYGLPLLILEGQQKPQHTLQLLHELPRLGKGKHIVPNRRVQPCAVL